MTHDKQTMIIFLGGVSIARSFTFHNGFTISKLHELPNSSVLNELKKIVDNFDQYILYKSVDENQYNKELFDLGVFTSEVISLNLNNNRGIHILAASSYGPYNVPNIRIPYITKSLEDVDLQNINKNLKDFSKRNIKEQSKIKIALMYLNKSKICCRNVNGHYEHAIFLRIALENCFNVPKERIEATLAKRAKILLNQFNSDDVNRKIKRFYTQTSGAIHSGVVPSRPKDNSKERKVKIDDYYMSEILAMSISNIITHGFPDWE